MLCRLGVLRYVVLGVEVGCMVHFACSLWFSRAEFGWLEPRFDSVIESIKITSLKFEDG